MQSKIKKTYMQTKKTNDKISLERCNAGQREVLTLKLLANEIGFTEKNNLSILDLGCADQYLRPASESQGWIYNGLDYCDVDFETGSLPFGNDSIDIAISLAVIEHLRDSEKFLSEIFRCLKPGGLIYLSTPNFQFDWKNFYNDPTHVRPYTPISLEESLRLHEFEKIHTFPGLRCKNISWYRGKNRFLRSFYFIPFRNDTKLPLPSFLKGHTRSFFALGLKPIKNIK